MIPRMNHLRCLQIRRCLKADCWKSCRNPLEERREGHGPRNLLRQNRRCRSAPETLHLHLGERRRTRREIRHRRMSGRSRRRHGLQNPPGRRRTLRDHRRTLRDHRRIGHWPDAREHDYVREEERMHCVVVARQIGSPLLERKNRVHLIGYQP